MPPPTTTESFFPLLDLPCEVLSSVLGSFLDGKSISTFLMVIQCSRSHQCDSDDRRGGGEGGYVLGLLRNALVDRYGYLKSKLENSSEEISDALTVLKEDIRTSEDTNKFPEWCAVLDYFESQLRHYHHHQPNNNNINNGVAVAAAHNNNNNKNKIGGLIVWTGLIETVFGEFQARLRCKTEHWTLGALQYWYNDIELQQFAIVHPFLRSVSPDQYDPDMLYGTIDALEEEEQEQEQGTTSLLQRLYQTLEHDPENWQRYLVLRSRSYDEEPTEYFTPLTGDDKKLLCYWDFIDHNYDWEEALSKLGENVIRIMTRSIEAKGSFP